MWQLVGLDFFRTGCRKWNCCVPVFNQGMMPFICLPAIAWKGLTEERGKRGRARRCEGQRKTFHQVTFCLIWRRLGIWCARMAIFINWVVLIHYCVISGSDHHPALFHLFHCHVCLYCCCSMFRVQGQTMLRWFVLSWATFRVTFSCFYFAAVVLHHCENPTFPDCAAL